MNVLVADDEKDQLEIVGRMLRSKGNKVLGVLSSEEALKKLDSNETKIDVVLTDYAMPGMDGMELLRKIREKNASLPVVMMTGYGEKDLVIDALRNRCDGFIEKPFSVDQIHEEIKRAKANQAIKSLMDKTGLDVYKELEDITFRSYAMYVEGKLLTVGLNMDELAGMTADMFVELMRVELGYLMLLDESSRELTIKAVKGLKRNHIKKGSSIRIEKPIKEWIVNWNKPILLSELDELPVKDFFRGIAEETGYEIVLSIPLLSKDKFIGLVNLGERESKDRFSQTDLQHLFTMSWHVAVSIENAKLYQGLYRSYLSTVSALAEAIESKDPYTRGHSDRVSRFATSIAEAMNFSRREIEAVRVAGILHDVGKIGIPEGLLLKFAPLTKAEFEVIKEHSSISIKIIEKAEFPWDIRSLARHHHERYDGGGYPDGLKRDDIPLGARILAVADTYEALLADRPYRKGFPKEKALDIIKEVGGTQLDPEIVAVFLELVEKGEIE